MPEEEIQSRGKDLASFYPHGVLWKHKGQTIMIRWLCGEQKLQWATILTLDQEDCWVPIYSGPYDKSLETRFFGEE